MEAVGNQADNTTQQNTQSQKVGPQFISEEVVACGKWLKLKEITYRDHTGRERLWESTSRTTKLKNSADAVAVLCTLRRTLKYDCLICVKQYRPAVKTYTLEFPAGLIDEGESAEQAAIRELKEETGYTATVKHVSPATSLDAGSEDCTIQIVTTEIDGDDPINMNPKPCNEETESIDVLTIPVDNLLQTLNDYAAKDVMIDSRVYSYAIALAQAHKEQKFIPVQK